MSHPDYYKILGVARNATQDEIRKAYKKLVVKLHPDANTDDESADQKFKQVTDAWNVLGDEKKRTNYDQYGTPDAPQFQHSASPGQGQRWTQSSGDSEVPFDLDDLFNRFRGGRPEADFQSHQRRQRPVRGQDIRTEVSIPFTLAAEGGKYDLRFQRDHAETVETITVTIPAGVDTGSVIRLAGQGTPGANGGTAGDMLVALTVLPHPWFRRQGNDILLDVPLSLTECALGAKVDIPTIRDGTVTLTIPEGSSSGQRLRLREKGIRDQRTGKIGDMFAVIKVVAPTQLSESAKELLRQLDQTAIQNPRQSIWN